LNSSGSGYGLVAGCCKDGCGHFDMIRNYQFLNISKDLGSILFPLFELFD